MPQDSSIRKVLMGFCLWQWKSLNTWILVNKVVSNLLIKRKKNKTPPQPKKANTKICTKHKLEGIPLVWIQKLDNMSSLFIFSNKSFCKQKHGSLRYSMVLNYLLFSVKDEIIVTAVVDKYLQWLIALRSQLCKYIACVWVSVMPSGDFCK